MSYVDKKNPILSLEDLVVRYICKNITLLTYPVTDRNEVGRRWKFPHSGFRIPAAVAQKILLQLCKRCSVNDEKISLFSSEFVNLVSPVIKDADVSACALRILKDFHLSNLSAINLSHVTLNSLIGCLGEWTVSNLISLNVTATSILCENNFPILVSLGRFKNLEVLNVSRTEFTSQCLQTVVNDLPCLTYINLSRTHVTDVSPLLSIRDRLTGLVAHRLELERSEDVERLLATIVQLNQLRVLDASDKIVLVTMPLNPSANRMPDVDKLVSGQCLPHLVHIDLSGNQFGLRLDDVRLLLANHSNLKFAGFASWTANPENDLDGIYRLSLKYPDVTIMGDRGDQLLLNTLNRNKDRAFYLQNALHFIFEITSHQESLKPELLHGVLRIMRLHQRRSEMILAGTAVIYNMTRGSLGSQLPLDLLNRAIRMTLTAMESFSTLRQLQKNCFLTLCSDTVLYRASFSCSQCCELVFNALIMFDDIHMRRMGVAIISILAAEITTIGLSNLTRDRKRLQRLLLYVVEKCLSSTDLDDMSSRIGGGGLPPYLQSIELPDNHPPPSFDTTLRFTLSALWNLTDECPQACQAFVEEAGLVIYERVLRRFTDQPEDVRNHVYTKCLGLLNNVAEVQETRQSLLEDGLMDFFYKMLRHPSIHISYFAAGVIAHLSCLDNSIWSASLQQANKQAFISLLGESVCNWQQPQAEMVAYRSFEPFEKLIQHRNSGLEVHLWATWAIHHILTKKEARYVPVLCSCKKLFEFFCYVASVDETVLCSNSLVILGDTPPLPNPTAADSTSLLDLSDSTTAKAPWLMLQQQQQGDDLASSSGSKVSPPPPIEGVSAFAGPSQGQIKCAKLIRSLAVEIIESVGRTSSSACLTYHQGQHTRLSSNAQGGDGEHQHQIRPGPS